MNDYLKYNLQVFLAQTKKISLYNPFFLFIFVLFLGVIFYCCCVDVYVLTSTNAQVICDKEECALVFYTSVFDSHQIEFVKVNQKTYFVNSFTLEEPTLDDYNNTMQTVTLKLKEFQGKNNEIVQLKLFKDKEKLVKRIFKIVVER